MALSSSTSLNSISTNLCKRRFGQRSKDFARIALLFIYLTHDVDFAVAQEGAQRVWLKSFNGSSWDWELDYG